MWLVETSVLQAGYRSYHPLATTAAKATYATLKPWNPIKENILFLLSGNDLVAREFIELSRQDKQWKKTLSSPKVSMEQISEANHTFSSRVWRDQVGQWTARWINEEK